MLEIHKWFFKCVHPLQFQLFPSFTTFSRSKAHFRLCLLPTQRRAVLLRGNNPTTKGNSGSRKGRLPEWPTHFDSLDYFPVFSLSLWFHVTITSFTASGGKGLDERPEPHILWWFIPFDLAKTNANLFVKTHPSISQFDYLFNSSPASSLLWTSCLDCWLQQLMMLTIQGWTSHFWSKLTTTSPTYIR